MKPLVTIPGMLLVCGFIAPLVPQAQLPCGSVADFTAIGAGFCADLPVSFDVNAPDPGYTYTWDFGDGTTSSDFQPVHVFEDATGEGALDFQVSLTVNGGPTGPGGAAGCTTTQTVSVLALPDPGLPTLSAICLGQDGFPGFDLPASTFAGADVHRSDVASHRQCVCHDAGDQRCGWHDSTEARELVAKRVWPEKTCTACCPAVTRDGCEGTKRRASR